ncbi:MAG: acyl-CoA/acyl-ACP dehydrogenase [Betaproteobacteria bacterium]|nr:acyl-CoA/acyl-ACP dehydrogenase [Betaproteobacteria bacterium]
MDLSLTSEQQLMVDAAKKMVDRHIQPILAANDRDRPLPKAEILKILAKAADLGLTAARIPEEGGGAGLRMLDYGLMAEQIPPSVALILQPHEATSARIHFGCTPEQRERFLPDLVAGRKIACTASTEPDVGSDPRAVKTVATEDGDHLVLKGRKQWISNATVCDVMNVTCRMANPDGSTRLARILVDRGESSFEARELDMMGLRQAPLAEVLFDSCRVPRRNLCPDTGDTARLLTLTWLANRPLVGLMAVNLAQKALDAARSYAGVRKQFGRAIGSFQLIQQDLAEIETAVISSRLVCYNALAAIDRGERANGLSAMAKRYSVDCCDRAVALAMRIHGAMGLSRELGLEQIARDVRTISIPDGTPGILMLIQGRELTGIDPFRS